MSRTWRGGPFRPIYLELSDYQDPIRKNAVVFRNHVIFVSDDYRCDVWRLFADGQFKHYKVSKYRRKNLRRRERTAYKRSVRRWLDLGEPIVDQLKISLNRR